LEFKDLRCFYFRGDFEGWFFILSHQEVKLADFDGGDKRT
jgi:hypothetical protein